MNSYLKSFSLFKKNSRSEIGASCPEYALLLSLLAIASFGSLESVGRLTGTALSNPVLVAALGGTQETTGRDDRLTGDDDGSGDGEDDNDGYGRNN